MKHRGLEIDRRVDAEPLSIALVALEPQLEVGQLFVA
jgi:hypothetical protein